VTTSALAAPVGTPDAEGPAGPAALATLGVSAPPPQPVSSPTDAAARKIGKNRKLFIDR
jgi:hypothetical protein